MPSSPRQRLLATLLLCTLLQAGTLEASQNALLARAMHHAADVDAPPLLQQRNHVHAVRSRRQIAMMAQPAVRAAEGEEEEEQGEVAGQQQEQPPPAVAPAAPVAAAPPVPAPPPAPATPWPTGSPDAGKTWSLSPHFATFAEFNILKWSSGTSNSQILTSGLPPYAFAPPITVPGRPKAAGDGKDAVGEDGGDADGEEGQDGADADGADAEGEDGEDSGEENEEEDEEDEGDEEEDWDDRRLHVVAPGKAAGLGAVKSAPVSRPVRQAVAMSLAARQPTPPKPHELISSVVNAAIAQANLAAGQAVIQTFYPQGSSNPGGETVGGSQFYGLTSLDLKSALSVTLAYSVFFPVSFDWVKGGKLPGLYGGRESCSGGDTAADCWSARFMWREEGMGELYLYGEYIAWRVERRACS